MPCDERRTASRGGLRRDHPERLREDRRHDAGVREREEVDEVAMLERPGEENALPGRQLLELGAVVAESDDDDSCSQAARASSSTWTPLLRRSFPK